MNQQRPRPLSVRYATLINWVAVDRAVDAHRHDLARVRQFKDATAAEAGRIRLPADLRPPDPVPIPLLTPAQQQILWRQAATSPWSFDDLITTKTFVAPVAENESNRVESTPKID